MLMKWGQSFAEPRRGIGNSRGLPLQTICLPLLKALLPVSFVLVHEKLDQRGHLAAASQRRHIARRKIGRRDSGGSGSERRLKGGMKGVLAGCI